MDLGGKMTDELKSIMQTTDTSPTFDANFKLVIEQDVREQIAKKIEAECNCPESGIYYMSCDFETAAKIARGQK